MPEISVIMPSYNVAAYIGECVQSVLAQSFQDIEIIMIDAMSTDGTLEIAKDCACIDTRIRLVTTDVKSYGAQINMGIRMAKGRYIAIVETDDVAEPQMLEMLYEEASRCDLDYVKGDYNLFISFGEREEWKKKVAFYIGEKNDYYRVINPCQHGDLYLRDVYLWRGLYKKAFLVQNAICFHETPGAAFQDVGFMFQVIGRAKRAMYIDKIVYNYRQNNAASSISNTNGFQFLLMEYPFVMQQCADHNVHGERFMTFFYTRMFQQMTARYRRMAVHGKIWMNTGEVRHQLHTIIRSAYEEGYFEEGILGKSLWFELMQYLSDEEGYWGYQRSFYETKRKYLVKFLEKAEDVESVVFYSRSLLAGFLHCLIKAAGIKADVCYCDNDKEKQGTNYMGARVFSVEEAVKNNPKAWYILANNHYTTAMKYQLLKMGIGRQQMHVCMMDMDILLLDMAISIGNKENVDC